MMATQAAMAVPRQPFSALHSPRLQHLQSSKNRQNGILASSALAEVKASLLSHAAAPSKNVTFNPPTKRRISESDNESDEYDAENIDPSSSRGNKRNKLSARAPSCKSGSSSSINLISTSILPSTTTTSKPYSSVTALKSTITPNFSLTTTGLKSSSLPTSTMAPPARPVLKPSSPRSSLKTPAGRSPKSRRVSHAARNSASSHSISSALPFSLDAALAGTTSAKHNLPASKEPIMPAAAPLEPKSEKTQLLEDAMPNNWFFDIYEDSPEEEATNLMEHSALTLDLSSDDEDSEKALERGDKGKENVAPEDYEYSSVTTSMTSSRAPNSPTSKKDFLRRKVVKADDMDDGERSPLSDLETDDFIAEGLTKDSCIVIPASVPESTNLATTYIAEDDFDDDDENINAASEDVDENHTADSSPSCSAGIPTIGVSPADSEEILIWEDDTAADDVFG